jgi:hypothetical protein
VVTSAKILGMTITDDLKWNVHVADILLKASLLLKFYAELIGALRFTIYRACTQISAKG